MVNQKIMGVILSYTAQLIQIITSLIYTPIMLRLLGQSEYGLYQLVNSIISYLGLLSLGFSSSYIRFYSRYKAKEDEKGIADLNGMFLMIFMIISLISLIAGGIMTVNAGSILGTGLTNDELNTAKVLMGLMTFNLALSFPTSIFDCSIIAHEKFVFQKLVTLLQYLLNPFLTLPLLLVGYGSISMVVISTILSILKLFMNVLYCIKVIHIKFNLKRIQISLLKEMWIFTFFIFINQIIDQINWSIDKFLLGRFIGTTAVAIYGLSSMINNIYLQFSSTISSVFIPKINNVIAEKNDNKELTQLFTMVGRIQFIILMLIITGFVLFGKKFIELWGGTGYEDSYYIGLWLMIPVTVPLIQNLGLEIQRAKNMHRVRSIVYFFISIGNMLASIPLIKMYGGIGAAIGTAVSLTVGNIIFMNWYYYKKIELDIVYFWKQIIKFLPAVIFSVICGFLMKIFIHIDGWSDLIFCIFIYTLFYAIGMWFLGINLYEKSLIKSMFDKVIKIRKRCF